MEISFFLSTILACAYYALAVGSRCANLFFNGCSACAVLKSCIWCRFKARRRRRWMARSGGTASEGNVPKLEQRGLMLLAVAVALGFLWEGVVWSGAAGWVLEFVECATWRVDYGSRWLCCLLWCVSASSFASFRVQCDGDCVFECSPMRWRRSDFVCCVIWMSCREFWPISMNRLFI
jgi:hypothetical protein